MAVSLSFFFGVLLLRLVQRTGLHQTDTLVVRRPIPLLRGAVGVLQLVILFGLFVIMTAGVGALLRQLFGLSSAVGSALFCVVVTLLSFRGTSGMVRVFSAVVPMLVICSVTVSVLTLWQAGWHFHIAAAPPDGAFAGNWAAAACIFVSYNLFSSIGILAPVGAGLRSRRSVWAGVLCGCVMLFSIALGIFLALQALPAAVTAPLPMLYAAGELGPVWYGAYALLLFGAMWGTALSPDGTAGQVCGGFCALILALQSIRLRPPDRYRLPGIRRAGGAGAAGAFAPPYLPAFRRVTAAALFPRPAAAPRRIGPQARRREAPPKRAKPVCPGAAGAACGPSSPRWLAPSLFRPLSP